MNAHTNNSFLKICGRYLVFWSMVTYSLFQLSWLPFANGSWRNVGMHVLHMWPDLGKSNILHILSKSTFCYNYLASIICELQVCPSMSSYNSTISELQSFVMQPLLLPLLRAVNLHELILKMEQCWIFADPVICGYAFDTTHASSWIGRCVLRQYVLYYY